MTAPNLQTERLILKALTSGDSINISYLLKKEIKNFSGPYMPHDKSQLSKHIERIKSDTTWGVLLKNSTFIGDIGITSIIMNKIGEMAWYFDPDYWGHGYATEASFAVIQYVFNTLNFTRICAQIDNNNIASKRLAERLGFELIAVLPEANLNGKIADIAYYSITNHRFISNS